MKKVKNHRRHARHPWKGAAEYRRSVQSPRLGFRELTGQGQVQNISRGGLCLLTDQRLAPQQILAVRVPLSPPNLSIPTLACVLWTRPVRGPVRYAAGLSFLV